MSPRLTISVLTLLLILSAATASAQREDFQTVGRSLHLRPTDQDDATTYLDSAALESFLIDYLMPGGRYSSSGPFTG